MSTAQSRASNKYAAKAYDRLYPFVPKGRKAEIQAAADALGESINDFIVKAIDERMERIKDMEKAGHPLEWSGNKEKAGRV